MLDSMTQFVWEVAVARYHWVHATPPGGKESLFLTDGMPITARCEVRRYRPDAGLFLSFADVKPAKASMQKFAGRYGLLTTGTPVVPKASHAVYGEGLGFWKGQVKSMAQAVRLWKLARAGDVKGLSSLLRWSGASVHYSYPNGGGVWIEASASPELLRSSQTGDLVKPAWFHLQRLINAALKEGTSEQLLWGTRHNQLSLYRVPKDLISAMWLQFARAIDGDRQYQQCEECRNWFEVGSADGGRIDKRYCGAACRARAWRKSKENEK